MSQPQFKRKSVRINNIRRAAPRQTASGLVPGNLIVNSTGAQNSGMWFSSRELRNVLVGAGLNADIPVMSFVGCTWSYDEFEITQAMLDENNGEIKLMIAGREVSYKKPGINRVNLDVDFSSVNITEGTINIARLSNMFKRETTATQPARPAVTQPAQQEEMVEEPIEEPVVEEIANANTGVEHEELVGAGAQQEGGNIE